MPSQALRGAVSAALPDAPPPSAPSYALAILLRNAADGRLPREHPFSHLIDSLRKDPDLAMFGGLMQVLPGHARRVEHADLAAWLIERAQAVGPDQAVSDLQRYLSTERLPCRLIVGVAGIKPDRLDAIGQGITLLPWEQLPESNTKRAVTEKFFLGGTLHHPEAALVQEFEAARIHVDNSEVDKYMRQPLPRTDLTDVLLCLGLFGPTAPVSLASWLEPPEWAPVMPGGYSLGVPEGSSFGRPFPSTAATDGARLFATWLALTESRRDELRVPMYRLNTAMRRRNRVDASIDLGIALESMFLRDLSDDRGELTFRLRVRGTRWLGSNPDERRHLSTLFADLYSTRSRAVHSGRVPDTTRGRPTTELLEEGYKVTARALVALITGGDPDWDTVTFG